MLKLKTQLDIVETLVADMFCPLQRPVDNTHGDKLGVWRDMRLADALVSYCGFIFTSKVGSIASLKR